MKMKLFKFSKQLLPMKGHYFLHYGGLAPVSPFLPVIAKDLGFSAVSVGWIYTVTPIAAFFAKPSIGALADRFGGKAKHIFLGLLLVNLVMLFAVQWVPRLTNTWSVSLDCGSSSLHLCSGKLAGVGYRDALNNASFTCEVEIADAPVGKDEPFLAISQYAKADFVVVNNPTTEECLWLRAENPQNLLNVCEHSNATIDKELNLKCYTDQDDLKDAFNTIASTILTDKEILSRYEFWMMLLLVVIGRSSMSVCYSLADSICFNLLGDKPHNYGSQRMWAGIGWGFMSFVSSMLVDKISEGKEHKDYTYSFYLMLGFFVLDFLVLLKLEMKPRETSKNVLGDVCSVIKDPKICLFIFWCFLNGFFLASISNFLFWYIEDMAKEIKGFEFSRIKTLEGLVLLIQCYAGEVPFFFFSGWILRKTGLVNAMSLVFFFFGVRFFLYTILIDPWWILPIETLHGITFGMFFATMTRYAKVIAPPGTECTVQSLSAAMFEGAGLSVGGLMTGFLVESIGYRSTFLVLAIMAVISGLLHFFAANFSTFTSIFSRRISQKGWILRKTGYSNAMTIVMFAFTLRFYLYSILKAPWWILPIETLHGITCGMAAGAMQSNAKAIAPKGVEFTVQTTASAIKGAGVAIGALITGCCIEVFGYHTTYFIMGNGAALFGLMHWLLIKLTEKFL